MAFDRELPVPWDACHVLNHGSLAWLAVNSSKPQRERVPQCFMVFSTKECLDASSHDILMAISIRIS